MSLWPEPGGGAAGRLGWRPGDSRHSSGWTVAAG